ncbi:MAG: transketolase [Rothia sp. (in: high G+C Gram-positive bacteria)]|uniref:transketolase n=1 Tax=Rothia sp. (in: high G+C Gram-positive bacteria) TaxID=1885016 RepID=UPI0026E032F5|nr:transketolase [Rothia sp. (in: high G+C Gram-positive bacteria)]MDO5750727.1 transketolase [Rothia sp. (in: high G+C Gram-positive bacteria)]
MANFEWTDKDQRAVDTARLLAADAVEKVGSGHPGTAMSLAPVAYLLFQKVMKQDPNDDRWEGRDRFILSPGHTSLTLYSQLFLGGYGLELDDLKSLRTWGALTPGHPEYKHTKGVEITTGPLGQGLASAVGFAYAQRYMRGMFDPTAPEGTSPFDHHVYVIASEGDVQEGVTAEASALAGHQELGNLIVIWDRNHISIEEDTDVAFTEDIPARYRSYGWDVQSVDWTKTGEYVEDVAELYEAIERAKAVKDKPSFIELRTIIGYPAPTKQNTGAVHGSKLGAEEIAATKKLLNFDPESSFIVEADILEHTRQLAARGAAEHTAWDEKFAAWAAANPEQAALYARLIAGELPEGYQESFPVFEPGTSIATRAASGQVINAIAGTFPELWGGSADLAGSNLTTIKGAKSFNPASRTTEDWSADPYGRVLHFGIREQAAAAIVNGIVLSSPTRAFSGTFFVFSDYQRPAVRLSALMGIPALYVWTHDSIGVGEDGPTHQPIEHLTSLRAIPGFDVVRPADANETSIAWRTIMERADKPAGLVLSRQNLPVWPRVDIDSSAEGERFASAEGVARGAYVLADAPEGLSLDVVLLATGSEVEIAVAAREALREQGVGARVVSVPSREWFAEQDATYRDSVIPASVKARVAVEAGSAMSWYDLLGDAGRAVAIDHFGASASAATLYREFGITAEAVVDAALESIKAAS